MRLHGKVAIVTGAGQGIGKGCALGLSREGAAVAVTDLDWNSARAAAAEIEQAGGRASAFQVDVRVKPQIEMMVKQVVEQFGTIDILVNNAGVTSRYPILELPEEEWDRILDTNLKSVLMCAQSVAPMMIEANRGVIINMSSIAADVPTPDYAHYGAAKSGIIQLTKSLALALAPYNIRVNAVQPGTVLSPMNSKALANPEIMAERVRVIPMGRVGDINEVVGPVLFLASDDSTYMTGTSLHVDGGAMLLR